MIKYINTAKTLPEIFEEIRAIESRDEKIARLKLYQNRALEFFVNGLYNVDWSSLPIPKYEPSTKPVGICFSSILGSIERIKSALNISKSNPQRAELLMIRVLESVSADEAELLINMFKGRKVDGISKAMFREVYPKFFRDEISDNQS